MKKIFLASQSPRRKDLLRQGGFFFQELSLQVSEFPDENLNINEQILDIARRKAKAGVETLFRQDVSEGLVLAADTVVLLDHVMLGKPGSFDEAIRYLQRLSGRKHEVKTAVVVWDLKTGDLYQDLETSEVSFHVLSDSQIKSYVATGDPMDKAGAYGIQGPGRQFVRHVEGNIDNVMGLPMKLVKSLLAKADFEGSL